MVPELPEITKNNPLLKFKFKFKDQHNRALAV